MDKCKDISPNVSKERTIFELNLKVKEHIKFFYVLFEIKTIMKCSSYRRFEILQNEKLLLKKGNIIKDKYSQL